MTPTATPTGVVCPLCGWSAPEFLPQGRRARPNARCGGCSCLERHRAIYLYLRDRTSVLDEPTRLLHFAPEDALRPVFERAESVDYITTDLEMENVTLRMDIGDLLFKDEVFDCVICSHVLEHIPDDRNAMAEVRRVLKPDGFALVLVPILSTPDGSTYEDPSIVTPEARERAYGQRDHVRIYGEDFPDRLRDSGCDVQEVNPGRDLDPDVVSTYGLLADERLFVCRRAPTEAVARMEASAPPAPPMSDSGSVGFVTRISPGDTMARLERLDHYFSVGLGALRLIEGALEATGAPDPSRILDLPSGHGRVLRMLRSRFPSAHITACDIDVKGIEFCAEVLGADATATPDELPLDEPCDLIWCGSLFTHLPERACSALLNSFADQLETGGTLVFTTHGDKILDLLEAGGMTVAVDAQRVRELIERYRSDGFGFEAYDHDPGGEYGISLSSEGWIERQVEAIPGLEIVSHAPGAWDTRQDVVVCQSVPS